jgi:hypothetical protein
MKIGTVLIAAIMAVMSLPALGQTTNQTNNSNQALADCVRAADQKYKDTWASLCGKQMGKVGYCDEFIGSPRDREFSQLRIEEMTLCSKLYR